MNTTEALNAALRIINGDLPGGLWCEECGIRTNHRDHGDADNLKPDEREDVEDADVC